MKKILIAYGSLTGNTQSVAEKLADLLLSSTHQVTIKNISEVMPQELGSFEIILMGSSTWDDGQLQIDAQIFADQLSQKLIDLSKTAFAVFGCGDRSYTTFCSAVDDLTKLLLQNKSRQLCTGLKIDGFPELTENNQQFENWSKELLSAIER
jgi:flavodoxin I